MVLYRADRARSVMLPAVPNLTLPLTPWSTSLDLHHAVMSLLLDGKLHLAPLDAPQRILDIGTGTGIWAIDVADEYPMAEVIGTDLSPIQPRW